MPVMTMFTGCFAGWLPFFIFSKKVRQLSLVPTGNQMKVEPSPESTFDEIQAVNVTQTLKA